MMAATTAKKKNGIPIEIDWYDVLAAPSSDRVDVCFAPSPSTAAGRGKGKEAGERMSNEGLRRDIADMSDGELRKQIAELSDGKLRGEINRYRGLLRPFRKFLREGDRRLRPLLVDEARRRKIDVSPAEDDDDRAKRAFTFDIEDEEAGHAAPKYCSMQSPICSTKRNYGKLGVNTRRSSRQAGQRKDIPVNKMYSSKSSSTALCGNKQSVHDVDSEEDDSEKYCLNDNNSYRNTVKRRKVQQEDSYFQKVEDVVLLDDDVQPEEPGECRLPDKYNELKIYYPSRDDPEAVELTSSVIKCLDPGVFLSSPVINYYIQYIKRKMLNKEDRRDKFHIFNTYFYSKLPEALLGESEFLKLRRWWKGVNIFQRGYIILPIHGMAHWSLIIICIPVKESNSGPIILHLDSLGMHPSAEIFDKVERYLEAEWCHLRKNPPSDISISQTIWEDLPRNIHKEIVQVPGQNNAYDCGIFMLYYIERFIKDAPDRFTRDKLGMFSHSWFKTEEASRLRMIIRGHLLKEFGSASDAMPEAATFDGSDEEGIIKGGESEAVAPCDSSEIVIEGGDTSISNEGVKEVVSFEETPLSTRRSDGRIRDCVLSEAATFSDGIKDDEDIVKADSDGSRTKQDIENSPFDRSRNNEEAMYRAPAPDIYFDSSDSDMEDVKIIEGPKQGSNRSACCIIS